MTRDPEEATDGPTDPRVHPEESPGFGEEPEGLEDIEVDRDVTIGEATPRELQATDVAPIASESAASKVADLREGDVVERRRPHDGKRDARLRRVADGDGHRE